MNINDFNDLAEVSIDYNPQKPYYDYDSDEWIVDIPPQTTFQYRELIETRDLHVNLEVGRIVQQKSGLICLESEYLFIADIDCGEQIEHTRNKIIEFQKSELSIFHLYKTKHGLRVIRGDLPYSGVDLKAYKLLRYLDSDPQYIKCCQKINKFVARITPKMSEKAIQKYFNRAYVDNNLLSKATGVKICHFLETLSSFDSWDSDNDPMLDEVIDAHDAITDPYGYRHFRLM